MNAPTRATGTAHAAPVAVTVREARDADIDAVAELYAHHVVHGIATFEDVPPGAVEMRRRWQETLFNGLPYLVAELEGRVVGYAYATRYRVRPAYIYAVEDSIYIADGMTGRGVGRSLLNALIGECVSLGYRQMISVIGDSDNQASIALHERCGFRQVGHLTSVGFKKGRWVDSVLMQRPIGAGDTEAPQPQEQWP